MKNKKNILYLVAFAAMVLTYTVRAAGGTGLFKAYTVKSITEDAYAVGAGDLNHDGRKDVVVSTYQGSLLVYLQDANGELNAPVTYTAGSRPETLATGDVNHDGWDDVVTANFEADTISVFIQQADGTLASQVTYATGNGPDSVAIGDLNNDGRLDVVVSLWLEGNINVFTQTTGGTLSAKVNYAAPQAGYDDISVGDVNGDHLSDVVKMNGQGLNPDLSVFTQNAGGTLDAAVSYTLPGTVNSSGVEVGDVTGDGRSDIVISHGGNKPNAYVSVFPQANDGTLQAPISYASYDIPGPVEIADVNLDGTKDVITLHDGWQRLGVFPQNNGSLASYTLYSLPNASHYRPQSIDVADINQDNLPDVLIANYNYGLVILYHEEVVPASFTKLSPSGGAANQPKNVSLTWTSSTRAETYEYCIDDTNDNACDNDAWVDVGTNTSILTNLLLSGTTYFWQVRAVNGFGTTYANDSQNNWASFSTGNPPAAFSKTNPLDASVDQSLTLTLTWNASSGATSYQYCYDTIDDDACNSAWLNAGANTSALLGSLTSSTTYFWQVRANNSFDTTYADNTPENWNSFTTGNPPSAFSKTGPLEASLGQPLATTITWSVAPGATSYQYCYDSINDDACNSTWMSAGTNTSTILGSLAGSTTYYWQIRALNNFGITYANRSPSDWNSFSTGNSPSAFFKSSPMDGSTSPTLSPIVSWQDSNGVSYYEYCFDTVNDGMCNTTWLSALGNTSISPSVLTNEMTYFWQVRAVNDFGTTYADGVVNWRSLFIRYPEPPTDIQLSNSLAGRILPLGTGIGQFSTTDLNSSENFTYTLVAGDGSADNSSFQIDGNVLKTAVIFNYHFNNTLSIRVRTTDSNGLSFEKPFTITLADFTGTFDDVPDNYWAWEYVERLFRASVTSGCNQYPLIFCPENPVTRAQMAVFVLKAQYGSTFKPPAISDTGFNDVSMDHWAALWIKQLSAEGITGGCGNGTYCPEAPVTRSQMAIFLLKAMHGASYSPPPAIGTFADVSTDHWAAAWIEQLATEGITSGCGNGNYCPENSVTRAQMAVFLVKAFNLP